MSKAQANYEVSYLPDIHRLLPQSPDAEQGVLSSFMLSPREVGTLIEEKGITPAHFHIPAHAAIFDVMKFLHDERMPIDFITLTGQLRDMGKLDQVGGPVFITHLFTFLPTAANAGYYLDILQEKFTLREIIKVCTEYAARSYDEQDDVPNLLHQLEVKVMKIASHRAKRPRHNPGAIAREIFEKWRANDTQTLFGIPTGIIGLDAEIGGIAPGDLIVICGPTSSGKTALAMWIEITFMKRGERVLDFSLEMTAQQKTKRMMQSLAGFNLRATMMAQREFGDVTERAFGKAVEEIARMKFECVDDRGATIGQLCSLARNLHAQDPFGLVVLDFDELVRGERLKGASKEEEVASISSAMKTLAGELSCPVLLLSQKTGEKLRWSSAKANDANVIVDIANDDGAVTLSVMKNRDGARGGEIKLAFEGKTTSFRQLQRDRQR